VEITLREINKDNWLECISLEVKPEQTRFVAPNLVSIIQAQFNPSWVPLAIYHQDTMVGFIMYGKKNVEDHAYWILRMMVDRRHQGTGYGKAALQAVIRLLQERADCQEIKVSYQEKNVVAEKVCLSLGFQKSGHTNALVCSLMTGVLTGRPWTIV